MTANEERLEVIAENWGDDVADNIRVCANLERVSMKFDKFLENCIACGGNWGAMLLTGIKELFPMTWDAIPDDMGIHAFVCLIKVIELCGVSTKEEE